jgi:hypothetical protein
MAPDLVVVLEPPPPPLPPSPSPFVVAAISPAEAIVLFVGLIPVAAFPPPDATTRILNYVPIVLHRTLVPLGGLVA